MKKNTIALTGAIALAAAAAMPVNAYEAGDTIVRVGVATVDPNESTDNDIMVTTPGGAVLPLAAVAGSPSQAGLDSDSQLGLTITHMLSSNFGVELLAATPFKHTVSAKGGLGMLANDIGETKHLPPTISLQWFPMDANSALQPYVGVGINYTTFFSEDVSQDTMAVLNGVTGATSADLEIDDSIGLALQVGVDYQIDENWGLNAAVWWIDIDTEAEITTNNGWKLKTDVEIDPLAYMVGMTYKF